MYRIVVTEYDGNMYMGQYYRLWYSCIYSICSDRTWGKYEYGTILQIVIQLIHFVAVYTAYVVTENRKNMNNG